MVEEAVRLMLGEKTGSDRGEEGAERETERGGETGAKELRLVFDAGTVEMRLAVGGVVGKGLLGGGRGVQGRRSCPSVDGPEENGGRGNANDSCSPCVLATEESGEEGVGGRLSSEESAVVHVE